jgi:CelD/BcsL family acetyltransferase involved in cellulose biosynthesis
LSNLQSLELLQGKPVANWLSDSSNAESWDRLYRTCPWSTAFLSRGFFELWTKHYGQDWNPVLVLAKDSEGILRALMPLCARKALITGAGAHQAEYQGWLGEEAHVVTFLKNALAQISEAFPGHRVRLRYLPPKIPQAAILVFSKQARRLVTTTYFRPLLKLDPDLIENKLKKKSNRSRWNRLKLAGDLVFGTVHTADEFDACLDGIVSMYDFRQGAVNDSLPFQDDPHKEGFYQDWFRYLPEQLHVTCMRLNGPLISALVGVNSVTETHLAILAHSPQHSRQSPGKLHLYKAAEALAAQGRHWLDLTPGGDVWKERFATHHDQVVELDVYPRAMDAQRTRFIRATAKVLRTLFIRLGISPASVRSFLIKLQRAKHVCLGFCFGRLLPKLIECRIYSTEPCGLDVREKINIARVDALHDLVRFKPTEEGRSRYAFLSQALSRLEAGETAYTVVEDQQLTHFGWVAEARESIFIPEVRQIFHYPSPGVLLYDFFSASNNRKCDRLEKVLRQMLSDLDTCSEVQVAYIPVLATNRHLRRTIEKVGFHHHCSLYRSRFLWYERRWQESNRTS